MRFVELINVLFYAWLNCTNRFPSRTWLIWIAKFLRQLSKDDVIIISILSSAMSRRRIAFVRQKRMIFCLHLEIKSITRYGRLFFLLHCIRTLKTKNN